MTCTTRNDFNCNKCGKILTTDDYVEFHGWTEIDVKPVSLDSVELHFCPQCWPHIDRLLKEYMPKESPVTPVSASPE